MEKYTFICEFQGGTYISQYLADSLSNALLYWSHNLNSKFFTKSKRDKINKEISNEIYKPVLINGVENVWSTSITIGRSLLLLNIVKTA